MIAVLPPDGDGHIKNIKFSKIHYDGLSKVTV